jgi:hypothetical protein
LAFGEFQFSNAFVVEASLPKEPDRSYLADAIHFMDLIDLADEELPVARATVERSKAAAVKAQTELDKHQQWVGRHQELYTQAVKGCEHRSSTKPSSLPARRRRGSPFTLWLLPQLA